jgi:hypothetical protein
MASYEFAIKRDTLNSGKIIYTPVCRRRANIWKRFNHYPWERITKIYNEYILLDLTFVPDLSYEECEQHIRAYQKKLENSVAHHVASEEFHLLEEKEY